MDEVRPLGKLPNLQTHQEWACEGGCDRITPQLYRRPYSQQWDKKGNLIVDHAELYYACGQGHILMVWDNQADDYAQQPDSYYQLNEDTKHG